MLRRVSVPARRSAGRARTGCALLVTVMGIDVALLVLLLLEAALFLNVVKPASQSVLLSLLSDVVDSDSKCVCVCFHVFLIIFFPADCAA